MYGLVVCVVLGQGDRAGGGKEGGVRGGELRGWGGKNEN